uniref:Enoyl reductase (ER) domain-containing protein n=1 Tax=Moniliophthora roreri TaxID=221103 RepID=A0A0W0FGT6_MONRR
MHSTNQQKSLAILQSKGPYTLINTPIPRPEKGEVLVKVQGAALNHLDWKLRYSPIDLFPFPLHTGSDGAGTVLKVGEGVSKIKEGDRILFQGWFDAKRNSFQEYAVVNENLCAKIPNSLSLLEAAAISLPLITAAFGLSLQYPAQPTPTIAAKDFKFPPRGGAGLKPFWEPDTRDAYAGQPIVVLGGSSSVGQSIQIAKYLGFSPIITTASPRHSQHLISIGATNVVDRELSEDAIQKALPESSSLSLIFDAVSCATQAHVDLLSPGGKFITVGSIPSTITFTEGRSGIVTYGAAQYYSDVGEKLFARLEELLEDGIIQRLNIEKLEGGLESIPDGLKRLQQGAVSSVKLVTDPSETRRS